MNSVGTPNSLSISDNEYHDFHLPSNRAIDRIIQQIAQESFQDLQEQIDFYRALSEHCNQHLACIDTPPMSAIVEKRPRTSEPESPPPKRARLITPFSTLKVLYPPGTPVRYYNQVALVQEVDEKTGLFYLFTKNGVTEAPSTELLFDLIPGKTYLIIMDKYYVWTQIERIVKYGQHSIDLSLVREGSSSPHPKRVRTLTGVLPIEKGAPLPDVLRESTRKPGYYYFKKQPLEDEPS